VTSKLPAPPGEDEIGENGNRPRNAVTIVQVVALEAAIIVALWFLGRMFS
jgi:hypothetical protein